ncbi:hypothetical protein CKA32_001969 [Geitlerinema sp. FC II]|nr:hypothetical protein CKA32_001969 [Geitlerinema sp. FC II]
MPDGLGVCITDRASIPECRLGLGCFRSGGENPARHSI